MLYRPKHTHARTHTHACTHALKQTQGEARYPLSAHIPEGVQPGDLITRDQDKEQLKKLFQELTIN